jgi:hypothetical protein
MQQDTVSRDELFVIDEKVSLNRAPCDENDTENEEGIVDENPNWTESEIHNGATMKIEKREGQFNQNE